MNIAIIDRNTYLLAFGITALIFIVSISLAFSPFIIAHPEIAVGITYDLTLTSPLLYLFFIRKTKIPNTTVVPILIIGIILASYIIPAEQQFHLSLIKGWLLPVVEILLLSYVGLSIYNTVKTYKSLRSKDSDIISVINEVCHQKFSIPFIANALAFEITVIYYAFISWKGSVSNEAIFSYHKKSGKIALFAALIFIIGLETIVLHIFVAKWNVLIAWILTISSFYLLLQLFAHLKAVHQRPIELTDDKLFIRYGLFDGTEINLENIDKVEFTTNKPTDKSLVKQVALLGDMEQFNTIIHLKNSEIFTGFYGIRNEYKTLILFIDEKERFLQSITQNILDKENA